jgi:hypothetical protein
MVGISASHLPMPLKNCSVPRSKSPNVANCIPLRSCLSAGWLNDHSPGSRNADDYGKTANANSTPACSSSTSPSWCFYSEDREQVLKGLAAAPALALAPNLLWAQTAGELKISHQFPGGTATEGDFRDRLCRRFSAEIAKRTNGALKGTVYPGSSLMKTNAQFSSVRKGALDMTLVPLSYAGGEVPETNIGLMPGIVTNPTSRPSVGRRPRSARRWPTFWPTRGC